MAVTLQDIADRCKVSRVTVSHVLRNPAHPRYAKTTKDKVLRVADELQYSPNLVAQSLRRGKTNLLGVIIPFNDPGVLDRIQYIAQDLGYAVMVQFSPVPNEEAEARALKSAIDRKVDGIIWQPCSTTSMSQEKLKMIQAARIPVVQFQTRVPHFESADYVGIDWRQAFEMAVGHLKASGYDRIAYLTQPQGAYEPRGERVRLFEQATKHHDASGDVIIAESDQFETAAENYLRAHPGQTVGFVGQGVSLHGILKVAKAEGLRVPEDVGILLLGDMLLGGHYHFGELTGVTLSAVQMPELSRLAMSVLVNRIKKKTSGPGEAHVRDVSLVQRESTVSPEH